MFFLLHLFACSHTLLFSCGLFSYIRTERIETGDGGTKKSELKPDQFFGDEVLGPGENQYAATVTALTTTTCWKIDKSTIKRTLGKVRMKRRASGTVA
mmetsp:Transcript_5938/g.12997  ORF Transcript_5938/g.12997 Transcript_5938/m.12997 type:complete len:98 (-) Transcript_5938:881-1174(-)